MLNSVSLSSRLVKFVGMALMAVAPQSGLTPTRADNTPQTLPFSQDWTNPGLITVNDDWSGVPGIVGYRGDGLAAGTGVDPQTVLVDGTDTPIDVNANQTNPNSFATGGVTEFAIGNPTVAIKGSGTAKAPFLLVNLNTLGKSSIVVNYNARDIDSSIAPNGQAIQKVALHYRVGSSGSFANIPAAYIPDATTGPGLAVQVVSISVTLPADANNQPLVQIRVMTTDAVGTDEWVGIDDIAVTGSPLDSDGDGTPDDSDGCPFDPLKITPGVCGCGVVDTDSDGDGTPNCNDGCPNDPLKIAPGACGCGVADIDTDLDGTPDCTDGCPADPNKIAPGACGCGVVDIATTYYLDSDGDGFGDPASPLAGFTCVTPGGYVANNGDLCPADPAKQAPGVCGCGVADTDSDGDGTPDCNDGCPSDPLKIAPGACGCGTPDTDSDNDGTPNCNDGCPNDPNKTAPGQCGCGNPETDSDGDGSPDCVDGCPTDPNKTAPGTCGCGFPDAFTNYYPDADGDTYGDASAAATPVCSNLPAPGGMVTDNTDCDDTLAAVNPGATEVCGNGIDDNCDGNTDEGCATPNTVYVNAAWVLVPPGQDPDGAGPATAMGVDAFADIQSAIDAVGSGIAGGPPPTINVGPGTYAGQLTITGPLNLYGPHANNCPGTSLDRGGEAVIMPSFDEAIGAMVIYVTGNGVTIKGFTINGDNPALNAGELVNGVDVNAANAVANGSFDDITWPFVSIKALTVDNNIIVNFNDIAVLAYNNGSDPVSDGNSISCNRVDNVAAVNSLGYDRIAVLLYNDTYAAVDSNVMTRVAIGVQTGNNYRAMVDGSASISSNSIEADAVAIWHNLHYAGASTWTIDTNTLTALPPTTFFPNYGLYISSIQSAVGVSVNDNDIAGFVVGLRAWNNPTTSTVTANGGLITGNVYGVEVTNYDPTYAAGAETTLALDGVTVSGSPIGVYVNDDPSGTDDVHILADSVTQTGISGSGGLYVTGSGATASAIGSSFTGNYYGVVADGRALIETTDLSGNAAVGLLVYGGGIVDAGDCGDSDTTGLGTGSGTNGSSTGGNDFSGYPDNSDNSLSQYAIFNGNNIFQPAILAQGNDFDFPAPITNIDDVVFDTTDNPGQGDVIAAQAGDTDGDGFDDCNDGCPTDPNKIAPGVCGCGVADTDSDGDLTPDCNDGCPLDPAKIAPGICGCGTSDVDTDGDLTPDCNDGCPLDPLKIAPGVCGCGFSDVDTDLDGTPDCNDGCPLDPAKIAPGVCGCGVSDVDTDGDGTPDCNDGCPLDPAKIAAGQCGCGVADTDTDGDGTADCIDGCPFDPLKVAPGTCGCGFPDITFTYYQDSDGDTYGNPAVSVVACTPPGGYVLDNTDCNDNAASAYPGATEICGDLIDNDCDGFIDEGFATPTTVYVDDDFSALNPGDDPPGAGTAIGCDAFATIQAGINAVAAGGTVIVATGSYNEDVNVNKTVSILGAGPGLSVLSGPIGGGGAGFQFTADGVVLDGFSITRDGNNPAQWNLALNTAGVAIQGRSSGEVRNCQLYGNRTGIDINNCTGISIHNNVIDDNRTGLIFRNVADNCSVFENSISNNWTVGVLFLDGSGTTNVPPQSALNSSFDNNSIAGNWYGQIVDRQIGGAIPAPGTINLKNFSGNWLGTTTPVITSANSTEPGYAGLIPVAYGGAAVPPGGQPDVCGPASANFDITPYLNAGTDTNVDNGTGIYGFQGDHSSLTVTDELAQSNVVTRIQEGHDLASGTTVFVLAGSYSENVVITKELHLIGAGSGGSAPAGNPLTDTIITAANAGLPVIDIQASGTNAGSRLSIEDLRVQGGTDGVLVSGSPADFLEFSSVTARSNTNGLHFGAAAGLASDILVDQCVLSANANAGIRVASAMSSLDGLHVTDGEMKSNAFFGFSFNPDGAATCFGDDLTFDGTTFDDNGDPDEAGTGHLSFFVFNGSAELKNLTLTGDTRGPIQFRGTGTAAPGTWLPLGVVVFDNVVISGNTKRPGVYIQRYSSLADLELAGLDTEGVTSMNGPFTGFAVPGMVLEHTGPPVALNDTVFPCQGAGYVGLGMFGSGGAIADCTTVFVGAVTHAEKEACIFDFNDNAAVGDVVIEPSATSYYLDQDNDGFGDPANSVLSCTAPAGYVLNNTDGCPTDFNKQAPGQCGCGFPDTDTDNDGTADCNDGCPLDPDKIAPGICGCGTPDTDSDGDGTANCFDGCPFDPAKIAPGVCGCGVPDTDSDGDGTPNCNDGCPLDPNKIAPGICGCGVADTDTDGDGTPNCNDLCPNDPTKIAPGQCGCGVADTDTDGDGVADCNDICPGFNDNFDADGDGTPDGCDGCPTDPLKIAPGACGCGVADTDTDGDGTPNCLDGCPTDPLKTAPGICGCGVSDADTDGDGTVNCLDGCPLDPNKIAPGICGCGVPDTDTDGDGTPNCLDGCPNDPGKIAPGQCGCSFPDIDSDSDGTANCLDGCPFDPLKVNPGVCGCGHADVDTDGDGVLDCLDGCPTDPAKVNPGTCGCFVPDTDSDGDGIPNCVDQCPGQPDLDSDGDGIFDCADGCPNDPNKIAPGICGCGVPDTDTDGDGTPNCNDLCPTDPLKVAPGQCGCGFADTDTDSDGTADCNDGCPNDPLKIGPGLCGCGVADTDTDGDTIPDCLDLCPTDPNKISPGQCGCGFLDTDTDSDGTADCLDLCPTDPNKIAPGTCGCGVPDVDGDGDGVADCNDICPGSPDNVDTDGDGTPDGCDLCPGHPDYVDCNSNGIPDWCDIDGGGSLDLNNDGIPDECSTCRADVAPIGGNGFVNIDDLLLIIAAWGTGNPQFDIEPLGGDGNVNIDDLLYVIQNWGACP